MSKQTPSKSAVDRAGRVLRSSHATDEELRQAYAHLEYWRASHYIPLAHLRQGLSKVARRIDPSAIIVQRLKRTPSIVSKLHRSSSMRLSQMGDIGGIRIIVPDMSSLRDLEHACRNYRSRHKFMSAVDYISTPKSTGYRSVHVSYRFVGASSSIEFDGRLIEVQLRTTIQHAWATAVETIGTFLNHPLKANVGPEEWLNLLKLVSAAFAHLELTPEVPGVFLSRTRLFDRIFLEGKSLKLKQRLTEFNQALRITDRPHLGASYYLLRLVIDEAKARLSVTGYPESMYKEAVHDYEAAERSASESDDIVLISAKSMDELRSSYPNYFLNAGIFLDLLEGIYRSQLA